MLSVSAWNHTHGADSRTRTGGQPLTRRPLYQLSYISKKECPILPASEPGGRKGGPDMEKRERYKTSHADSRTDF